MTAPNFPLDRLGGTGLKGLWMKVACVNMVQELCSAGYTRAVGLGVRSYTIEWLVDDELRNLGRLSSPEVIREAKNIVLSAFPVDAIISKWPIEKRRAEFSALRALAKEDELFYRAVRNGGL